MRRHVTRHLEQLRQAGLGPDDPLYVQVAVELFMNHKDSRNRDRPYPADALDALENLPQSAQTPYLRRQHQQVLWLLGAAPKPAADAPAADSVGIGPLDRVARIDLARDVVASTVGSPRTDAIGGWENPGPGKSLPGGSRCGSRAGGRIFRSDRPLWPRCRCRFPPGTARSGRGQRVGPPASPS